MLSGTLCRFLKPKSSLPLSFQPKPLYSRNMSTVQKSIDKTGAFIRKESAFRNWIKPDSEFPPESGRYHIYISHACPWAHRTAIVRKLKGLEDAITVTPVDWLLAEGGWKFAEENPDPNNGFQWLREVYEQSDPQYQGSYTVPVLYDKKSKRIVNNESSEIIRMFNDQFNEIAKNPSLDLYPEALRSEIEAINAWVYPNINNGVYRAGFAQSQEAFDAAYHGLFEHLDKVEEILSKKRFLTGKSLTEADVRLFTTLVRFDPVYATHFKCNKKRLTEYPNIFGYTREIYQLVKDTVDMYHIKHHYYVSHQKINTYRIVPGGFDVDYDAPHGRDHL